MAWYDKTYEFIRSKRTRGLVRRNYNLLLHGTLKDESRLPLLRLGGLSLYDYIDILKEDSVSVSADGTERDGQAVNLDNVFANGAIWGFVCGAGHPSVSYPPSVARVGMVYFDKSDCKVYQADRDGTWKLAARVKQNIGYSVVITEGDNIQDHEITSERRYNVAVYNRGVSFYLAYRDEDGRIFRNLVDGHDVYECASCVLIPGSFPGYSSRVSGVPEGWTDVDPEKWIVNTGGGDWSYELHEQRTRSLSYALNGTPDNPSYWIIEWSGGGIHFTKSFMRKVLGESNTSYPVSAKAIVYDIGSGISITRTYYDTGYKIHYYDDDHQEIDVVTIPSVRNTTEVATNNKFGGGLAYDSGILKVGPSGNVSYESVYEHHNSYSDPLAITGVDVNFSNYGMTLGVG